MDIENPVLYLIEVVNDEKAAPERRDTCAIAAAPYMMLKMGTAVVPRYLEAPIEVPEFQTVDQAETFLASLPVLLGNGQLDSQTALELSTLTRAWISARHEREELQLKITNQGGHPNQVIRIEGGLPELPGTNLIMPHINGASGQGSELNGKTIDLEKNPGPTLPAPAADDQTSQDPGQ